MQTTYVEDTPLEGTSHSDDYPQIPFVHIVQWIRSVMITERGARVLTLEPTRLTWNTAGNPRSYFPFFRRIRFPSWDKQWGVIQSSCPYFQPLTSAGAAVSNGLAALMFWYLFSFLLATAFATEKYLPDKGRSNGIAGWEEFQCQLDRLTNLKPRPMQLRLIF